MARVATAADGSADYTYNDADFYPYRYLSTQGFLPPGYIFTRLPVRALAQRRSGRDADAIARPRPTARISSEDKDIGSARSLLSGIARILGSRFLLGCLTDLPDAGSQNATVCAVKLRIRLRLATETGPMPSESLYVR